RVPGPSRAGWRLGGGREDRRLALAERRVAEVVLETGAAEVRLARMDLDRDPARVLGAVDACEQDYRLPLCVAEALAREQRVEASRRVALGEVAGEAGDAVRPDHVTRRELCGDGVARAVEDDPPDRGRLARRQPGRPERHRDGVVRP